MIHTRHGLELDDLKLLLKGKIQCRKCLDCDVEGLQYWDGETGMGVSPTPSGINSDWLSWDNCETCHGLGYQLFYV